MTPRHSEPVLLSSIFKEISARLAAMKITTSLFVLLLGTLLASPVLAADCADMPADPAISTRVDAGPVQYDRSLSVAALSGIPSESRRGGVAAYDRTLGLTEATFGVNHKVKTLTVPDGSGGFCTTAQSAEIVLKWKTTVHIASQIKPGTCMDQEVGTHEAKHVAIDRALMPIARRAVELAVTSVIRHGVAGATVAESQRNLQDQVQAAIELALDTFSVMRLRRQLALDNPEEYDKVPQACGVLEYIHMMHQSGDPL